MNAIHSIVTLRPLRAALALTLAVSACTAVSAPVRYEAKPGSKLRIDGTSSIHDWLVESKIISGFLEMDPSSETTPPPREVKPVPRVAVEIPVRSLKSQVAVGASVMDRVMYSHLKQEEKDESGRPRWPQITYTLIELAASHDVAPSPNASACEAKGALSVCGVTRTNGMPVTIERVDQSTVKVRGSVILKMSDFGIARPAPMIGLGAIKTGDEVKITFEWLLGRQTGETPTRP
jgi:hypothetical protein